MSIPTKSLDDMIARAKGYFRTSFRGYPLDSKKFLGRSALALAKIMWNLHNALEQVEADLVPSSNTSDDVLSAWAQLLGLPDGQGGHGRILPTIASGGVATLTGVSGTVYPAGAIATAEDGTTQISLDGSVTIPGSPPGLGSVTGTFTAITSGTVGNLPVGSVLTWQAPPSGADSTFTLTSPLGGATDTEDNASVFARIVARLQNPPRGGVTEDYHLWAQIVAGVAGIYVYPKRSGTGTVDVVITTGGSGQGRVPSDTLIAAVQTALDSSRPAGAEAVTALKPSMPNSRGHLIRVQVVPTAGNEFDWDDTAGPYSVFSYSAGPPATLTLNTTAPASLKAAITAYIAGTDTPPRLQVISTGSVVNQPVSCVNYSDSGGRTTLTLDTLPTGFVAPTTSDAVYAYGPPVSPIATAILTQVDSLGPSKASGFADQYIIWDDTLYISDLIALAEEASAPDGTPLIVEVPVGGATIDGTVANVEGNDVSMPELLYASHILVTQ